MLIKIHLILHASVPSIFPCVFRKDYSVDVSLVGASSFYTNILKMVL